MSIDILASSFNPRVPHIAHALLAPSTDSSAATSHEWPDMYLRRVRACMTPPSRGGCLPAGATTGWTSATASSLRLLFVHPGSSPPRIRL